MSTQIISNPNSQIEAQVYNKTDGRIAEILEAGSMYLVEYSRIQNDYRVERKEYAPNYACAILRAKYFCETGTNL